MIPFKVDNKVNNELVIQLEDLVKQAKSGELTAIAYANIWSGGDISTGWAFPDKGSQLIPLIGELDVLRHLLIDVEVGLEKDRGHDLKPI